LRLEASSRLFGATKIQELLPVLAAKLTPDPSLLKRGEKIQVITGCSPYPFQWKGQG
jgi:hypothetical protein